MNLLRTDYGDGASRNVAALTRDVARLTKGQKVRVTFTDGVDDNGTLLGASILCPDSRELWLDGRSTYRQIRYGDGTPATTVATIDDWDDEARFDRLMGEAQDYHQLEVEAMHCPKSEKGWREKKAAEAKDAFIAEWLAGEVR